MPFPIFATFMNTPTTSTSRANSSYVLTFFSTYSLPERRKSKVGLPLHSHETFPSVVGMHHEVCTMNLTLIVLVGHIHDRLSSKRIIRISPVINLSTMTIYKYAL
jgi:hypothetical protein